ncbi:MAG: hypothetical protein IJ629_07425, partial [Clostridia bacterium]|nr:hypothetical protein [Clostridia bacterium]
VLISFLGGIGGQILIIIGVITAVIAIIMHLWNTNEEFRNKVTECWNAIKGLFEAFGEFLKEIFSVGFEEDFGFLKSIMESFKEFIANVFNAVVDIFSGVIDFLTGIFTGDWDKAFSGLGKIFSGFKDLIAGIGDGLKNIFGGILEWLSNVFAIDWSQRFGAFGDIINGFSQNISNKIAAIKTIFNGIIDFVTGVFTGNWSQAWEGVTSIFSGIMEGLGAIIKTPLNAVIGLINACISGLNKISVKIPDYVPVYGGKTFGFNIPKIPLLKVGIANVPYDNYPALLHEGERVLTKEENKAYQRKQSNDSKNVTYNLTINVDKVENGENRDIETLAKDLQFYFKRMEAGKGIA